MGKIAFNNMVKQLNNHKMEQQVKDPVDGQCNKDSDCTSGCVCVNGKCVPDIAAEKTEGENSN